MANGRIKQTTTMYRTDNEESTGKTIAVGTIVGITGTIRGEWYKISRNVEISIPNPYYKANIDTYYYSQPDLTESFQVSKIKSGTNLSKSIVYDYSSPGNNWYITDPNGYFIYRNHFTLCNTETLTSVYVRVEDVEIIDNETASSSGTIKNTNGCNLYLTNDTSLGPLMVLPKNASIFVKDVSRDVATQQPMSYVEGTVNGTTFAGYIMSENAAVSGANTTAFISNNDSVPQTTTTTWSNASIDWKVLYEEWLEYNIDAEYDSTTWDDEYYHRLSLRHFNALGYPPKFNMDIDLQYTDQDSTDSDSEGPVGTGVDITPGIGRVFAKTFLSNPPILSICPGKVKMFPDLMGVKKDNFIDMMADMATSDSLRDKINSDDAARFSGRLYQFEADTQSYGRYVNALCRACAIMLGIGDEKVPNLGSKQLKNFDYAYWSLRADITKDPETGEDTSIWKDFFSGPIKNAKKVFTSLVEDTTYLNFFLHGSETSVSESISTDVENSPLDSIPIFNTINSLGSVTNYLTGAGFTLGNDQSSVWESLKDALGWGGTGVDGLMDIAKNVMKGGKVVLPKMVSGATYGKSISCNTRFISPYGDKLSVFLKCIIPICHLLALALPRQISDNMYTYPFVISANQLGQFNVDLGVVTNMNITRGGMDNTSWTINSLPTEWDVSFDIIPLVDELMMTGTNHPVLFCKNVGLLSYLGNMCGFDLIANNADTRLEITKAFIINKFSGYPRSIENRLVDQLNRLATKWASLAW